MLKMSLEIPLPNLEEFLPLTDFAFGLAHLCLPKYNKGYVDYCRMYKGCLLDNSMYELGDEPLPIDELREAANACEARAVIAPDWMDDFERTRRAAFELADWSTIPAVGVVVQGKDLIERAYCFREFQKAGFRPICFPMRRPRTELISYLQGLDCLEDDNWYHLLGLHSLEELYRPPVQGRWSYDTAKPFKGVRLDQVKDIRGHGRLNLNKPLSVEERINALWNIAYMRKLSL